MVWKRWTRNLGAKTLSLVISVALWFSVTNQIEFEKTLAFPIEYVNMPAGITPVEELPRSATTRIRARGKFLRYRLRGGVCRVDLAHNQPGMNNLVIDGANLVLPAEVAVIHREIVEPRQIAVEFDDRVVREIAISPSIVGQPDSRYVKVGKTFVSPAIARVVGPRKLVDEIGLISTVPIDIDGNRSTVRKRVKLEAPGPRTVTVTPNVVEVGITIEPRVEREIAGLALELAGDLPAQWRHEFVPSSLSVEVSGARSIVDVAAAEVTTLTLHTRAWTPGTSRLQLAEVRGREIIFTDLRAPPAAGSSTDTATNGGPPSGTEEPRAAADQVIGRLPLPGGVEVLGLKPPRFTVTIAAGEREESELAP